jgi:hypothetical protein
MRRNSKSLLHSVIQINAISPNGGFLMERRKIPPDGDFTGDFSDVILQ